MLLGRAVGSVGDITFSVVNGKQVIKAKPATVKNRQTKAQMIQIPIYDLALNYIDPPINNPDPIHPNSKFEAITTEKEWKELILNCLFIQRYKKMLRCARKMLIFLKKIYFFEGEKNYENIMRCRLY